MPHARTLLALSAAVLCLGGITAALAHPWGGLVVDANGHVYFTFICPFVDEDHHACVWRLDDEHEPTAVLVSRYSPSDIVLARSRDRTVFGAERTGSDPAHRARLWQFEGDHWKPLIAPTTDPNQFHVQTYAVSDAGTIYFARGGRLYARDSTGGTTLLEPDTDFGRIDAMAWGPEATLYLVARGTLYLRAPDGTLTTRATGLKEEDPEDLPFAGANILFDVAVDERGNAFVAYYGNRRVLKVSPSGAVTTFLRAESPWSPHGVDVFEGALYVLESTVGGGSWWSFWERPVTIPRVREVRSDGTVTTVFEYRPDE